MHHVPTEQSRGNREKAPLILNGPQQQGKHKSQPQRQPAAQVAAETPHRKPTAASPAARQATNTKTRDRLDRQPTIRGSRRMRANTARNRHHEKAGRTPISDHQLTRRHSTESAPQHAPPPAEERQHSTQRRQQERPHNPASAPATRSKDTDTATTRHSNAPRTTPKANPAPHPTDAAQTPKEKPKERHQSGPTRTHEPRTTTPKNTANAQRGRNATNRKRPTNKVKTEDSWGQVIEGVRLICSLAYDVTQSHAQNRVRTTQNTCAIYTQYLQKLCVIHAETRSVRPSEQVPRIRRRSLQL